MENQALVELIRSRLAQDNRIAAMMIDISCSEGYVSLVGTVDTSDQKTVALELVIGMIGVRNVKDELQIRKPRAAYVEAICC